MTRACLVIGLGGVGWRAARECRSAYLRWPRQRRVAASFVGLDIGDDQRSDDPDLVLFSDEPMREVLAHLDTVIDERPAWEKVLAWFPDRHRFIHTPTRPDGSGRARPVGRLALWIDGHAERIRTLLWQRLDELRAEGRRAGQNGVNVVLLSSAWGGTGSAWIIDVAAIVRSITTVRRLELFMATPSSALPRSASTGYAGNAYATLLDIFLCRSMPSSLEELGLGGPHEVFLGDELYPYVVMPRTRSAASAARSLSSVVVPRLDRGLQAALSDFRRDESRVHFLPKRLEPPRWLSTSHAASMSLTAIETELLARAVEREKQKRARAEQPSPDDGQSASDWLRRLESRVLALAREEPSLADRLAALGRREAPPPAVTTQNEPGGERQDPQSVAEAGDSGQPAIEIDRRHPLLSPPRELRRFDDLRRLLAALGRPRVAVQIEEVLEETRSALVGSSELQADAESALNQRLEELRPRVAEAEISSPRLEAFKHAVEQTRAFEKRLGALPRWRRLLTPRQLRPRHRRFWHLLVVESILVHEWPQRLAPALMIAVLSRLENDLAEAGDEQRLVDEAAWKQLEQEVGAEIEPSGKDAESAQEPKDEGAEKVEAWIEKAAAAVDRDTLFEVIDAIVGGGTDRASRAGASDAGVPHDDAASDDPPHDGASSGDYSHTEGLAEAGEVGEAGDRVLLADLSSEDVGEAIKSCLTGLFSHRLDSAFSRGLWALVPERLVWPQGEEALFETIRRHAREALGVEARILEVAGDQMLFYFEETSQPLENFEALPDFEAAYAGHEHPSTLHIDRRWLEGRGAPKSEAGGRASYGGPRETMEEGRASAPWPDQQGPTRSN